MLSRMLVILAALLVPLLAASPALAQTKVNVGYVPTTDFLPVFVSHICSADPAIEINFSPRRINLAPRQPTDQSLMLQGIEVSSLPLDASHSSIVGDDPFAASLQDADLAARAINRLELFTENSMDTAGTRFV